LKNYSEGSSRSVVAHSASTKKITGILKVSLHKTERLKKDKKLFT